VAVVIGEESLMHLALVVVVVEVAVVVTMDETETETETVGVEGVEGDEAIGIRDRGPVRGAHRDEEIVTIDSRSPLLIYDVSSFL